jgi:hypothetical protein
MIIIIIVQRIFYSFSLSWKNKFLVHEKNWCSHEGRKGSLLLVKPITRVIRISIDGLGSQYLVTSMEKGYSLKGQVNKFEDSSPKVQVIGHVWKYTIVTNASLSSSDRFVNGHKAGGNRYPALNYKLLYLLPYEKNVHGQKTKEDKSWKTQNHIKSRAICRLDY